MSLTASMWTGVSGLLGHGEKMNVVGNNIANVSTVGFRAQRMDFEDFIYATAHSAAGPTQIGRGVDVGIIMNDFSQGAFESTTSAVDLAIGGAGFFRVQPIGSETSYFTRAGNFHFNVDGYLVDPHGYALQGWKIDNTSGPTRAAGGAGPSTGGTSPIKGAGVPRDVRLDTWTVPPKQTTKTSVITVLAADGGDSSRNASNPFAALLQSWDGTQPPPNNRPYISESSFSYSTSIKVYDEGGLQHTLTVYYDKVDPNTYNGKSGETLWEYIVTMDPAEDKRQVWDASLGGGAGALVDVSTTKMAGLLMSGVMTFSAGGDLVDQTAYTLLGNIPYTKDAQGNPVVDPANPYYAWKYPGAVPPGEVNALVPVVGLASSGTLPTGSYGALNSWQGISQTLFPASVSQSGYPMLVANFGGVNGAQTTASPKGDSYLMEFNLGARVTDYANPWTVSSTTNLYQSGVIDPITGLVPPNLTENEKYTKDNLNGPKIVQKNMGWTPTVPDYNEQFMKEFQRALAKDIADAQAELATGTPPWNHYLNVLGQPLADGTVDLISGGGSWYVDGVNADATHGEVWNLLWDPTNGAITTGRYGSEVDAMWATWPYMATNATPPNWNLMGSKPYQGLQADNQWFVDFTPNTTQLAFVNGKPQIDPNHTQLIGTSYATGNGTGQNGYTYGNLTGYNVDQDGVLYGVYSNGVTLGLYQITLYDFTSKQNLRREGGNLFSQTIDSGDPYFGPAQTYGLGKIISYSIEQSNVDMAREFVQMITTQRGFQANSKVITTTDTMLETVVNMKR